MQSGEGAEQSSLSLLSVYFGLERRAVHKLTESQSVPCSLSSLLFRPLVDPTTNAVSERVSLSLSPLT